MDFKRSAILTLAAGLIVVFAPGSAGASETARVTATVHQFVDGFNKGDAKTALAACASPAFIVDEFPPHEWYGATACADWSKAYDANAAQNGITDGIVTLGTPWRVDIAGDRAYFVAPAIYTYQQRGTKVTEAHSVFTVALRKVVANWRITGWAWSRH